MSEFESGNGNDGPHPFRTISLGDLDAARAGPRWLVEMLWPADGLGLIGGEPKTNKSILVDGLAVAVASGQPFLGHAVPSPGPVVIFNGEESARSVGARIRRICLARSLDPVGLPVHVIDEPSIRLDKTADLGKLRRTVGNCRSKLLILDPLRRLMSGSENDSAGIASVLGGLRTIGREFDCAIAVVHHFRKAHRFDGRGRTADRLRGSGDLFAAADAVWLISSDGLNSRRVEFEMRDSEAREPLEFRVIGGSDEPLEVRLVTDNERDREVEESVLAALDEAGPLAVRDLARMVRGRRSEEVVRARRRLVRQGRVEETREGQRLVSRRIVLPDEAEAEVVDARSEPSVPGPQDSMASGSSALPAFPIEPETAGGGTAFPGVSQPAGNGLVSSFRDDGPKDDRVWSDRDPPVGTDADADPFLAGCDPSGLP